MAVGCWYGTAASAATGTVMAASAAVTGPRKDRLLNSASPMPSDKIATSLRGQQHTPTAARAGIDRNPGQLNDGWNGAKNGSRDYGGCDGWGDCDEKALDFQSVRGTPEVQIRPSGADFLTTSQREKACPSFPCLR